MANYMVFDLVQEITRLDGSVYDELGNIVMNGRAEYAAEQNFIKQVRILKLNIPHSNHVEKVERYINDHYSDPGFSMKRWEEWKKPPEIQKEMQVILNDNRLG
ncbi:hypothetical protein [Oenococcus oeni]|uniref:Uncharacterized protein n=3 Tax=Oenococcus oeni TaxID=1247 RepID=Q04DG8_OENOB|nr:hypothetical protein [Oenococcus oeni]ABJ57504.1 hypothetical protein OEOE_1654 [Oenococcus oeni PSU-1]AWW98975.1 hypothetical protein C5H79_05455 [Oenococcus oeni]EFD87858.1 hypothetical protein AWRIB429_1684 [Oenococcus oeni AWRIB429]EJO00306.1 hypothetical protein AWRIB419_1004 [Oenococcus oeni AWRIB419]EJO00943.1 hypothetical protein AWRIB318_1103 [Oenococcus oeni AWRIB318]